MNKKLLRILGALACAFVLCLALGACGGSGGSGGSTGGGGTDADPHEGIEEFIGYYQGVGGHEGGQDYDEAYMEELRESGYNIMLNVTEDQITVVTPNGTDEIDDFTVEDGVVNFKFDSAWDGNPSPATLEIAGNVVRMDYEYNGEDCYIDFDPMFDTDYEEWLGKM